MANVNFDMINTDNRSHTNTIRNEEFSDEEEKEIPTYKSQPFIHIRTQGNQNQPQQAQRVMTDDLRQCVRSKEDLYQILAIEGQLHLPPFDDCPMDFLRAVLSGAKLVFRNAQLRPVNVPRYKEFNAHQLYVNALQNPQMRRYLPECQSANPKNQYCNRKFLFNIINTMQPEYFETEIQRCLQERKQADAISRNRYIEIQPDIMKLIMRSNHVSKATRGKALSLLHTQSSKRSRQQFNTDNDIHQNRNEPRPYQSQLQMPQMTSQAPDNSLLNGQINRPSRKAMTPAEAQFLIDQK